LGLLVLLFFLLGRRKKCSSCSRRSARPEDDGWIQDANKDWYCDECKDKMVGQSEAEPEEA
jgi:hypothetical protein